MDPETQNQHQGNNTAATQAPITTGYQEPAPQPPMMSYNSAGVQKSLKKRGRLWLVIGGGGLLASLLVYFVALPVYWSQAYLSAIKTPYDQQAKAMAPVYDNLSLPVYTDDNSSVQTDTQNFAQVDAITPAAQSATDKLAATDHLIVLPGTTVIPMVARANSEHKAMKQYVSDSQLFLTDFKVSNKYMSGFESIINNQLPAVTAKLNAVSGSKSTAALQQSIQDVSAPMGQLISSLKALDPGDSFKGFQSDLLLALSNLNGSLQGLNMAISNKDSTQLNQSIATMISSSNSLAPAIDKAKTETHQMVSDYQQRASQLKAQNPLTSK